MIEDFKLGSEEGKIEMDRNIPKGFWTEKKAE